MTRMLIVFGLILGIGFWISSKDDEKTEVKTEEAITKKTEVSEKNIEKTTNEENDDTTVEEDIITDESVEVSKENTKTEPEDVIKKNEKTEVVIPTKPVETVTTKITPVKKEIYADNTTELKVFLYEWGIDISEKQIKPGKVIFNVVNNGKFTHEFIIRNVKNYGKVLPGETKQFVISLRSGKFEIYSDRRDDYDRDMKETLSIIQ